MSSTMSTLRMPNHTLSPSTSPTRPTRMSTTPKICANRLSAMSDEPPRVLHRCLLAKYTSWVTWWMRVFLAFIHSSAWKRNSRKFAVASYSSTRLQPLDNRPWRSTPAPNRGNLVAVVAPMCIKGLRLVTMQLPEKFSPIGAGPTELRIFGFLGSSSALSRRAAVLPILPAALFVFEPLFKRRPVGHLIAFESLSVGHGGAFEGPSCGQLLRSPSFGIGKVSIGKVGIGKVGTAQVGAGQIRIL